jgi:hypothetical protein
VGRNNQPARHGLPEVAFQPRGTESDTVATSVGAVEGHETGARTKTCSQRGQRKLDWSFGDCGRRNRAEQPGQMR